MQDKLFVYSFAGGDITFWVEQEAIHIQAIDGSDPVELTEHDALRLADALKKARNHKVAPCKSDGLKKSMTAAIECTVSALRSLRFSVAGDVGMKIDLSFMVRMPRPPRLQLEGAFSVREPLVEDYRGER